MMKQPTSRSPYILCFLFIAVGGVSCSKPAQHVAKSVSGADASSSQQDAGGSNASTDASTGATTDATAQDAAQGSPVICISTYPLVNNCPDWTRPEQLGCISYDMDLPANTPHTAMCGGDPTRLAWVPSVQAAEDFAKSKGYGMCPSPIGGAACQ